MIANDLGDQGSIPVWVIPKAQKLVLNASLLNIQHCKVWIKGKWDNPGKGVAPSPTPWFSSYWKGCLWGTFFTKSHKRIHTLQPLLFQREFHPYNYYNLITINTQNSIEPSRIIIKTVITKAPLKHDFIFSHKVLLSRTS